MRLLLLLAAVLAVPLRFAIAQTPRALEYTFTAADVFTTSSVAVGVRQVVDGQDLNIGQQYSASPPEEIRIDTSLVIAADVKTADFSLFHVDFIDTPRVIQGSFDLGFRGEVLYAVTVTDAHFTLPPFQVPLSPAQRVLGYQAVAGQVTYAGTVDMLGSVSAFSVTGPTLSNWSLTTDASRFTVNGLDVQFDLVAAGQVNNFTPEFPIIVAPFEDLVLELRIASDVRPGHRRTAAAPIPALLLPQIVLLFIACAFIVGWSAARLDASHTCDNHRGERARPARSSRPRSPRPQPRGRTGSRNSGARDCSRP